MEAKTPHLIDYPDSDGLPMADNTRQFDWIVTIKENLDAMLDDFVAGNLFWYPIEGDNKTRLAPDALVALGRPKGHRGSYKQWEEDDVAPQVVFEVLSPKNTLKEMAEKRVFYETFGAQEFYIYDPDTDLLEVWIRSKRTGKFESRDSRGWVSPLLGIRFDTSGEVLVISRPDGAMFETVAELHERAETTAEALGKTQTALSAVEAALSETEAALSAAEAARQRLEAQLRRLGIEPEGG